MTAIHLPDRAGRPLCASPGSTLHHYTTSTRWGDTRCIRCTQLVRNEAVDAGMVDPCWPAQRPVQEVGPNPAPTADPLPAPAPLHAHLDIEWHLCDELVDELVATVEARIADAELTITEQLYVLGRTTEALENVAFDINPRMTPKG